MLIYTVKHLRSSAYVCGYRRSHPEKTFYNKKLASAVAHLEPLGPFEDHCLDRCRETLVRESELACIEDDNMNGNAMGKMIRI